MTKATTAPRKSRYTDEEREAFKAQRAAYVAALDTFEIEPETATEIAFERLTERYSERNSMLILIQCPASFGDVKAMSKWNEDGRKIKKGAKSIYILAPAGDKRADVEIADKPAADAKPGEAPSKKRFIWVRVFDRSQTEPLPSDWKPRTPRAPRAAKAAPVAATRTAALDDFLS
jgi:hypothetical protein